MPMRWRHLVCGIALLALGVPMAHAKGDDDRVHFFSNIIVNEGEDAGSLVCIACSIRVQGTSEDVVALGGSVLVEGTVKGDLVAIGGGAKLTDSAEVTGDVVTVGGLWRDPNAVVKGEISSESGMVVHPLLILIPLLPVVAIVALVWWLISRNRRRVPGQPYPTTR